MENKKSTKKAAKKTTRKDELQEVRSMLQTLSKECADLRREIGVNSTRISSMEVVDPPEVRRLTTETVSSAIAENPYAEFEVLKDFYVGTKSLRTGSVLRADMFETRAGASSLPHLVSRGLHLGTPLRQEEAIAKVKAAAEARIQVALAETSVSDAVAHNKQASQAFDQANKILEQIPKV